MHTALQALSGMAMFNVTDVCMMLAVLPLLQSERHACQYCTSVW